MKEKIEFMYLEEKKSQVKIAKELGLTEWEVRKKMKEFGIPSRGRGYIGNTKSDYFDKIDSANKAYILGLITADGGIAKTKNYVRLELKAEDKHLLEKIIELVAPGNKVSKDRECFYINFCSKKLVSSLLQYGLTPRKSLTLSSLPTNLIPKEFYPDYIRGLYDGDGTVTMSGDYLRIGYNSGSKEFLENFKDFLCAETGMKVNKTYKGSVYFTSWGSRTDIQKFYEYIYKGEPELFLKRKYDKISKYVNTEVS